MSGLLAALAIVVLFAAWFAGGALWRRREVTVIHPPQVGLLYRDGVFERELPPGRYVRFDLGRHDRIVRVALAGLSVTLPEITVLSRDQFSFRVQLAPVVTVTDPRRFVESQPMVEPHPLPQAQGHPALYPGMAAAALEAAGAHALAEIVGSPARLTEAVQTRVAELVPGATIGPVLLTAINLPPEVRRMFTEVERSRVEAQSALERARGEQAALRVLANAARLVADNPALANLRLLQAIETAKGPTTIVLGEGAAPIAPAAARRSPPAQA